MRARKRQKNVARAESGSGTGHTNRKANNDQVMTTMHWVMLMIEGAGRGGTDNGRFDERGRC